MENRTVHLEARGETDELCIPMLWHLLNRFVILSLRSMWKLTVICSDVAASVSLLSVEIKWVMLTGHQSGVNAANALMQHARAHFKVL